MHHQIIECEVGVPLDIGKDRRINQWVVDCSCLKIATQAMTKRRAQEAFAEALIGWLDSCIERNTLDQALEELGFVRGKGPTDDSDSSERSAFVKIRIVLRNSAESLGVSLQELKERLLDRSCRKRGRR